MTVHGACDERSVRHCRTGRHVKALECAAADGVRPSPTAPSSPEHSDPALGVDT